MSSTVERIVKFINYVLMISKCLLSEWMWFTEIYNVLKNIILNWLFSSYYFNYMIFIFMKFYFVDIIILK